MFFENLDLLQRIDSLIRRAQTGTPRNFAEKLGVSRSTVHRYISQLRDRGIPINYCQFRRTYYYECEVIIKFDILVGEKCISLFRD